MLYGYKHIQGCSDDSFTVKEKRNKIKDKQDFSDNNPWDIEQLASYITTSH